MKLATIRTLAGTRAVRLDGETAVETGDADVGAVLTTRIAGIGECRNTCRAEKEAPLP